MKQAKVYKVVLLNKDGKSYEDSKVYKTLQRALARLSELVMSEELRLQAGFGQQHRYTIVAR